MASSKDLLDYILDRLSSLSGLRTRKMMGEYIIYYNEKIAAYLCDDRLMVKPVEAARVLLPGAPLLEPYPGAKQMLLVENIDDADFLCALFEAMEPELSPPRRR